MYEVVISNVSGLYRYRFGDVIRVVGFMNEAPIVQFMYRQGQLLNVRGEKTSEKLFYDAFHDGFQFALPDNVLVDYCCAEQHATKGMDKNEKPPVKIIYIKDKANLN